MLSYDGLVDDIHTKIYKHRYIIDYCVDAREYRFYTVYFKTVWSARRCEYNFHSIFCLPLTPSRVPGGKYGRAGLTVDGICNDDHLTDGIPSNSRKTVNTLSRNVSFYGRTPFDSYDLNTTIHNGRVVTSIHKYRKK